MEKEVVMYSRSTGCPYSTVAKRVFGDYGVDFREIMIDENEQAYARVVEWTGFASIPTIVAAELGDDMPVSEPEPLEKGISPKNIDRGSIITEPSYGKLSKWLRGHGFVE
jgi:glutaredoxin